MIEDAHGTPLQTGDSAILIKDLNIKGFSKAIKQGTVFNNIKIEEDLEEDEDYANEEVIEVRYEKSAMMIRPNLLKKKA